MITLNTLLLDPKLKDFDSFNFADKVISDNGRHSIKSIADNRRIKHLNLSLNWISKSGFEMIVYDLSKRTVLKSLDLDAQKTSIHKNLIGVDEVKCITAVIL